MLTVSGRVTLPVLASTVMGPPTEATLIEPATINFAPLAPGRLRMPSLLSVLIDAITSRVGIAEAENKKVFTPGVIGTGALLVQSKLKVTLVGAMGLEGVRAKIKHPAPPAAMSTGVFRAARGRLVAQFR